MVSMTLDPARGTRLSRAWNSPQRRWSGVKVKPARRLDLALGRDPHRARQRVAGVAAVDRRPRAAGEQDRRRARRRRRTRASASSTIDASKAFIRSASGRTTPRHHCAANLSVIGAVNHPNLLFNVDYATSRARFLSIRFAGAAHGPSEPPFNSRIRLELSASRVAIAEILSRIAAELALFAGAGFLLFAVNDLLVDLIYFGRRSGARLTDLQPLPARLRQLFRVQRQPGLHRHPGAGVGRIRGHRADAARRRSSGSTMPITGSSSAIIATIRRPRRRSPASPIRASQPVEVDGRRADDQGRLPQPSLRCAGRP